MAGTSFVEGSPSLESSKEDVRSLCEIFSREKAVKLNF